MERKKKEAKAMQEDTRKGENRFSKEQMCSSVRFRERKDIVNALLKEGELYTIRDVEEKIEKYMKGEVK